MDPFLEGMRTRVVGNRHIELRNRFINIYDIENLLKSQEDAIKLYNYLLEECEKIFSEYKSLEYYKSIERPDSSSEPLMEQIFIYRIVKQIIDYLEKNNYQNKINKSVIDNIIAYTKEEAKQQNEIDKVEIEEIKQRLNNRPDEQRSYLTKIYEDKRNKIEKERLEKKTSRVNAEDDWDEDADKYNASKELESVQAEKQKDDKSDSRKTRQSIQAHKQKDEEHIAALSSEIDDILNGKPGGKRTQKRKRRNRKTHRQNRRQNNKKSNRKRR